jgi:hypothetical protein
METMATKKVKASEEYCYSCESLLLTADEKHGPFCLGCFQKTKRKDPLMQAAIRQTLVAVVPIVCPHDDERHHRCRTSFNVLVLDKKLEPVQVTGPYSLRAAEKLACRLRKRTDRRK